MEREFLRLSRFAVVGASKSRDKFGNKVLRSYLASGLDATPVNPRETEIEGVACVKSLDDLPGDAAAIGVSVVTPPAVTLGVVEAAARKGISHVWLQPGAESAEVIAKGKELGLKLIHSGPCVLVALGFDESKL